MNEMNYKRYSDKEGAFQKYQHVTGTFRRFYNYGYNNTFALFDLDDGRHFRVAIRYFFGLNINPDEFTDGDRVRLMYLDFSSKRHCGCWRVEEVPEHVLLHDKSKPIPTPLPLRWKRKGWEETDEDFELDDVLTATILRIVRDPNKDFNYVAVMLRERGMRAVAIGTQVPMLQDGKADTTGTAGETVDHLPCKAVAGTARHAAVGADAQLRPTAKSRMDHTVVTDEIEYVIIQYGREHGGKNQRYRSEFPWRFEDFFLPLQALAFVMSCKVSLRYFHYKDTNKY